MELNGSWYVSNPKPEPDLMKNLYKFEQAKPMELEFIQFHDAREVLMLLMRLIYT